MLRRSIEAGTHLLEWSPRHKLFHLWNQSQDQPDKKSGLGHHVWDRWTRRQRTQLEAQVAGSLIGIDRAIPAPNRAVVQTQLV